MSLAAAAPFEQARGIFEQGRGIDLRHPFPDLAAAIANAPAVLEGLDPLPDSRTSGS
jgi:hypothetical protein